MRLKWNFRIRLHNISFQHQHCNVPICNRHVAGSAMQISQIKPHRWKFILTLLQVPNYKYSLTTYWVYINKNTLWNVNVFCVSTELRGGAATTYWAGAEEPETDPRTGWHQTADPRRRLSPRKLSKCQTVRVLLTFDKEAHYLWLC